MGPTAHLNDTGRQWLDDTLRRSLDDPAASTVFVHEGPMDHTVVQELVERAESWSLGMEDGVSTRKRLVNVLVEGLENMLHHTLSTHREMAYAWLVRDRQGYRMGFGNAVPLATAALLTHRVGILNEMDEADLKEHYLKLLSNDRRSEHGGAGLGLLTMARKSGRSITTSTRALCGVSALFAMELWVEA